MRPEPLKIVLAATMAGVPGQGGATWAILQWILGLRRLGHEVTFVEPVDVIVADVATGFFKTTGEFGISDAVLVAGRDTLGMPYERILAAVREADLLLNVSGVLDDPALLDAAPVRVWVDLDPAFNQLWHAQGIDMGFDRHTHFVTVGLNLGTADCPVPALGQAWLPMLPPVVLEHWPVADDLVYDALTTIGNWRGYGSIEHEGVHYGQKAHSVRTLIELPSRLPLPVLVAFSIHPDEQKDIAALAEHGWRLADPVRVAGTPESYRAFVQGSRAELGIAKSGYVVSRSGWFSDRSACYLASGRPVVAQDTGLAGHLPVGEGLLTFSDADGAVAAVEAMLSDEARHRRAAREIAREHLHSDKVLGGLLAKLGA